ncbi:MAG: Neelaredoxin [Elusimicrobia bacterium RIFOXYA2_FULL_50_26]|nr:MAG: Neelaredoxin [Elusimicrobia bacterium RIFOXYA2_FULL_50_26]OGS24883.1 MAG: Neelaredoxin [Elusimicrobia bacterium RIFOXYB2_FULL_50_12]
MNELFQAADWKKEKHVPVIEIGGVPKKGEYFTVNVTIGKDIPHPNTTDHHIQWIELYFKAEGEQFPFQVGRVEFSAHGASVRGPDTSGVYTHHNGCMSVKTDKPGTLLASSYCNIHGLWQSQKEVEF